MSKGINLGDVYWVSAEAIQNVDNIINHPVAVIQKPIGGIWRGAMRTSRVSTRGGSIPSEPIPSLGLKERKNWNIDPILNVLSEKTKVPECNKIGPLPKDILEKILNFVEEYQKATDKNELERKISTALSGRRRRPGNRI